MTFSHHSTCAQTYRFVIRLIRLWSTPYDAAICRWVSPAPFLARIDLMLSAVSLACQCCSPCGSLRRMAESFSRYPGRLSRRYESRMLSPTVPNTKCAGLQHGGLSQRLRITWPVGIGRPLAMIHAMRWLPKLRAGIRDGWKAPYPYVVRPAFHGQQSSASPMLTRDQNRPWRFKSMIASNGSMNAIVS